MLLLHSYPCVQILIFSKKNREPLQQLSDLNKKLESLIGLEKSREIFKQINDSFANSNYLQSLLAINNKQADKDKEFEKMMEPLKPQIDTINNQVKEASGVLDEMVDIAKELNSKKSAGAQTAVKVIEEMNFNITVINEINDDFQQGTTFYNNLTLYLTNLQKIVSDFSFARGIDKTNRLQELEAQKACQNFNKPQFFKDGQFPSGESSFRPAQPYPIPGAQPNYQANNQPQSTMISVPVNNHPSHMQHMPKAQPQVQPQPQYQFSTVVTNVPVQPNINATSQYGYMGFQNPAPANNANPGFAGFGVTESSFVPNPFPKK